MEYILHTKIYQRFQDLQYETFHVRKFFKQLPDGGISILSGEIVERSIGSVKNFSSGKFLHEKFINKFGPASCKLDLTCTIKSQGECVEISHFNVRYTGGAKFGGEIFCSL